MDISGAALLNACLHTNEVCWCICSPSVCVVSSRSRSCWCFWCGRVKALCPQNLRLPPHHVDVNLHPTKSEVGFLHTDSIICTLQEHVQAQLGAADTQRTYIQARLPGAAVRAAPPLAAPPGATSSQRALGIHDRKLVRTDPRTQTLHAFAVPTECHSPTGAVDRCTQQEEAAGPDRRTHDDGPPPGVSAHMVLTQSTARKRGAPRGAAALMRCV